MKNLGKTIDEVLVNCPSNIFKVILSDYVEDFNSEVKIEDKIGSNLISDFGGYFYLIETVEDLKNIETAKLSPDRQIYLNILEAASQFDNAEELTDGYVTLFLATNNSGGNTYIIPKNIVDQCPNIKESIRLTNENN